MASENEKMIKVQIHLKDITQCPICLETCNEPKILPCIHTFCMNCLSKTGAKSGKGPGDRMLCPLCRKDFEIPEEGFSGLQKNFFMERLIDTTEVLTTTSTSIFCDACKYSDGIAVPADRLCADCHVNLCTNCCTHHRRRQLYKDHRLVEFGSQTAADAFGDPGKSTLCLKHKNKTLDIYCCMCKATVCFYCFIKEHNGHDPLPINEAAQNFRKQIQVKMHDLNKCIVKAKEHLENLKDEKNKTATRFGELEKEVINRREFVKQVADKHAEFLLIELQERRKQKLKEFSGSENDVEMHLYFLESFMSYCSMIIQNGTDCEICQATKDLELKANQLEFENSGVVEENSAFSMSFTPSKPDETSISDGPNLIGQIQDGDRNALKNNKAGKLKTGEMTDSEQSVEPIRRGTPSCEQTPYVLHPPLIHKFKTRFANASVWGLTILEKKLFIITHNRSEVESYNSTSFEFVRMLNLNDMKDPYDIISCSKKSCLYIVDWKTEEILKVNAEGILMQKWPVPSGDMQLSITQESNVLAVCLSQNELYEYTWNGELIRMINLEITTGIVHPLHAIKLPSGNFLISYGYYYFDSHGLLIIDANGILLKIFGGERGSTDSQVNVPAHLVIGAQQSILVADHGNRRILLLDSELNFLRQLIYGLEELRGPRRMFLDESTGRLFVADSSPVSEDSQIFVFEI